MRIRFSDYARDEIEDASNYLEREVEGLGVRFRREIRLTLERIRRYPNSWAIERGDVRRCFVHKFRYKVLYSVESDHIFVIAVAHQHRKPDYWIDRLSSE